MPRIYRTVGTDKDGLPVEVSKPNEQSARRSVEDTNQWAAKSGRPQDWRAEYADIEWRPLDSDSAVPTALERVRSLAEKWENATDLGTGQPSIVARAFAAEIRKALDPEVEQ